MLLVPAAGFSKRTGSLPATPASSPGAILNIGANNADHATITPPG